MPERVSLASEWRFRCHRVDRAMADLKKALEATDRQLAEALAQTRALAGPTTRPADRKAGQPNSATDHGALRLSDPSASSPSRRSVDHPAAPAPTAGVTSRRA